MMNHDHERAFIIWLAVLGCLLAGCGGGGTVDPGPSAPSPTAAATPSGEVIDGTFDVGGHRLYLTCEGGNGPTVLYLHGAITDAQFVPHQNASAISTALSQEYRVCRYDRRNLGSSDTVDSVQTPKDAMEDLHRLLDAAGVEPPYVLLGASFGGMLAYLYANTYPDEVIGMVLLDSMFPDELTLEYLFPPEEHYVASDKGMRRAWSGSATTRCSRPRSPLSARSPKIPVTYLASIPEGYQTRGVRGEVPSQDRQGTAGVRGPVLPRHPEEGRCAALHGAGHPRPDRRGAPRRDCRRR